jgi:hypothetical protein
MKNELPKDWPQAPGRRLLTRRMMHRMLFELNMPLYFYDRACTRFFYTTRTPKSLNDFMGRENIDTFPRGTGPIVIP